MSFDHLLAPIIERHPCVRGVVFCDYEGEMVSQRARDGLLSHEQLRLIGATGSTWLATVTRMNSTQPEHVTLALSGEAQRLLLVGMRGGYHLLAVLAPHTPLSPIERALRAVAAEMDAQL